MANGATPVRPFILTRSTFMGGQKYGAIWTGDNMTGMKELQGSLHMVLNSGLAGQAFIGADTPGFVGRPSEAMFVASYQLATFWPFFRAHSFDDD